jgi:hypothetical protein
LWFDTRLSNFDSWSAGEAVQDGTVDHRKRPQRNYFGRGKTRDVTKTEISPAALGLGTSNAAVNRKHPMIPYAE